MGIHDEMFDKAIKAVLNKQISIIEKVQVVIMFSMCSSFFFFFFFFAVLAGESVRS